MNSLIDIKGTGVALATPFNADFTIDYDSLGRLVDYQIENGVDYIVVLGTTGEAVTMTWQERVEVARFVVEHAAGRIPLVLGMSSNATTFLVEQLRTFDLSGYSAILSVVPFYNRPSQEGLSRHFSAIAEASPLPVILYNVPSRTGANLEAATTLSLARRYPGKIIGIKEASGRIGQIREIIEKKPQGFRVISGDDALTLPLVAMGAEGVISVIANALPERFSTMVRLALEGRFAEAGRIDRPLQPLYRYLFTDGNPSGIKALLNIMGLAGDVLRLPLVPVSAPTREALAASLAAVDSVD
ncbi:MAG TPA: 4-hydroxy-tetrahydrodipicolinate synthase [Porphyromonadaceae bacterium]|nr:4-hydroxy-tetrahydrodipicolinate synthase [Muribaculaceae bacterium Isolate-013 (NCI)]HAP29440.1 4-hydroxy-tetrahydrodipicolinate synthase [Porphyromonadaceae bacterium]